MKMQNEPTRCSKKKKTEEKEKKIIKYIFLIQKKPSDMRSSINFTSIERFNKRRSILYRLIIIIKWTQTPQSILSHFEAQTWPRLFLLDHAIRRYIVILWSHQSPLHLPINRCDAVVGVTLIGFICSIVPPSGPSTPRNHISFRGFIVWNK